MRLTEMTKTVFALVLFFLSLFFAGYVLGLVDQFTYICLSSLAIYVILLYLMWQLHLFEQRLPGAAKPAGRKRRQ